MTWKIPKFCNVIGKQRKIGLAAVTDGKFRCMWWHLNFLFEPIGVKLCETKTYSTQFKAHMPPKNLIIRGTFRKDYLISTFIKVIFLVLLFLISNQI